jgi:hydrogenase maturation protease
MNNFKILLIGYGNTLRNDDGVGVRIAEIIAQENLPNVQVIATHQLTPELAADIANVSLVIFVDAVLSQHSDIQIEKLAAVSQWNNLGHAESPASLLALTEAIYQQTPIAWGVFIPAINCEFGEELSPITQKGLTKAIEAIKKIITSENLTEYQRGEFDNQTADNFQE